MGACFEGEINKLGQVSCLQSSSLGATWYSWEETNKGYPGVLSLEGAPGLDHLAWGFYNQSLEYLNEREGFLLISFSK